MQENKASRGFLLTAVILGILAMALSFAYLQSKSGPEVAPEVTILVASHDLRASSVLEPDKDLKEFKISSTLTSLYQRALKPADRNLYKLQRINRDIPADDPVVQSDFVAAVTLELTGDNRALSIPARGANALSGLLVPGDYVKLLVTRALMHMQAPLPASSDPGAAGPAPAPQAPPMWETLTICPAPLKVLAVGSRLTRPRIHITMAEQYDAASQSDTAQSVTLEVTEAQAKTILEQTAGGQVPVTLILCPPPQASSTAPAK